MDQFTGGQAYEPLRRLISDSKIQEIQKRVKTRFASETIDWKQKVVALRDIPGSTWEPKYIIAIDGDYSKTVIENGYPGAEIGYITTSSVVIFLDKVRALEKSKFIDPIKFRETEKPTSLDSLFVGCNVVLQGEDSAASSMRRLLFDELKNYRVFSESETLLETYESLLKARIEAGGGRPAECPHENCNADYEYQMGEYSCQSCHGKLYSTDALRLHELLNPSGTSGEMYGQIQETIKKLLLIHILRAFEATPTLLTLLRDVAFFMEGTLAVFSTASWLAVPIRNELARINAKVKEAFGTDLIIIGIERTGSFVNHFEMIDTKRDGQQDNFPPQSAFLLDNTYIKENIVINDRPDFVYLKDTAFGRKLFYKTSAGFRVVPSIATYSHFEADTTNALTTQFPRLAEVLGLLDKLVSSRYQNTVTPLATAHAEAAIPLNLGKRIFDDIARKIRNQSE